MITTDDTPNLPGWIDLGSPDPDASAAFYRTVFGWSAEEMESDQAQDEISDENRYLMLSKDGQTVGGLGAQQDPTAKPAWTLYVRVPDIDATVATCHGVVVLASAGLVHIPYRAGLFGLLLAELALTALAMTVLGAMVAVVIRRARTFATVLSVLMTPLIFLSGLMFPVAHRQFHRFQGRTMAELLLWLKAILRNTSAHLRRSYRTERRGTFREVPIDAPGSLTADLSSSDSSPSALFQRREAVAMLQEATARLSARDREVLWMKHHDELTFEEVGRKLAISSVAARKAWLKALERLREQLDRT